MDAQDGTQPVTLFADLARIGPFFAVATGPPPAGGGWAPLSALADAGPGTPLGERVTAVRAALGTDDRVAASTAFLGLAAQVVGPLFAAAAVAGLPRPAADRPADDARALAGVLHWRAGGPGPWLWWAGPGGRVVADPDPGAALGGLLTGLLAPVAAAVRARVPVAPRVLWGNVASAVGSARRLVAAARPADAARATVVAERLLTAPPLAATAALRAPEPPDLRWTFRRRSCCLYFRVPGAAVCGDCVLLDRPGR